ncbi:hypothetical protein ACYRFT_01495 [Listeria kieliensis]
MKIKGLDGLNKKLKQMQRDAEELQGENSVPFEELFSQKFMLMHTKTSDIYSFLKAGGFDASSNEEFDSTNEAELDKYINSSTTFKTWEEMKEEAVRDYTIKKLGL